MPEPSIWIDSHAHLSMFEADEVADVLERAADRGVIGVLAPATGRDDLEPTLALAERYRERVVAAVGVHPHEADSLDASLKRLISDGSGRPGVVAVGEIGLDYYRQHTPFDQQRMMFREQLKLAEELNLPVIIHNRDASHDLMAILTEWHAGLARTEHPLKDRPGVLHSFSADLETGQAAIAMNFCLGITGPVTFTNAPDRKAIVRNLPLDHLLLETDSPYLTPHPHRGKRNEPVYIPLIAEEIARLHNTSPKEVAEITYANARRLFKFD